MEEYILLHNKRFSQDDLSFIRQLIASEGHKGRAYLSKELCQIWGWRTPGGQLRDITARAVLRKLERLGQIVLPPPLRPARRRGYKNRVVLTVSINSEPFFCSLSSLQPLSFAMVRGSKEEKFYNALIDAYHYLGYHQGSGEQLKYIIYALQRPVACIGFSGSAFKIAPRDQLIGWSHEQRQRNLSRIVNNSRFLILPWVKVANLASFILGAVAGRIQKDWLDYYQREIVLLETFVEKERFFGTCYKAANWIYLGQTQGRGRNDRHTVRALPIKDIYIYPLVKDFQRRLKSDEGA